MGKVELLGITTACVFALLGFLESGIIAATGTAAFAAAASFTFAVDEENKRKSFARTKKAIIRRRARCNSR